MRKPRENKHNRVYHLISQIAHRAFFLSADGDARVARFVVHPYPGFLKELGSGLELGRAGGGV